jgi:hypothetical protein
MIKFGQPRGHGERVSQNSSKVLLRVRIPLPALQTHISRETGYVGIFITQVI